MSDEINWIPVGTWSTMALFQFGGAVIDIWKSWRRSRRVLTGYEKVLNGELVNGWRIAIPWSIVKNHDHSIYDVVFSPWPVKESGFAFSQDSLSLLVGFEHKMPDGRYLYVLSQFSTIADVSFDIFQMIYNGEEWSCENNFYITNRIVAVVFRKINTDQYRLILIDVVRKSHRFVTIKAPAENARLMAAARGDVKKNRINVVFSTLLQKFNQEVPASWQLEIYDVPYEIAPSGNSETPIESLVWQSISIPMGQRNRIDWHLGLPNPMFVVYDPDEIENIQNHRLVTFDQNNDWRIQNLSDWMTSMRDSKFMNAIDSLGLLDQPAEWYRSPLSSLRNFTWARIDHPTGSSLLSLTYSGGILQRSMHPPSLKRVAAEIFCRKNSKTKFAFLKKVIGFDIFDRMLDEDDKDLPVIRPW